jgi:hypothetical protein
VYHQETNSDSYLCPNPHSHPDADGYGDSDTDPDPDAQRYSHCSA